MMTRPEYQSGQKLYAGSLQLGTIVAAGPYRLIYRDQEGRERTLDLPLHGFAAHPC